MHPSFGKVGVGAVGSQEPAGFLEGWAGPSRELQGARKARKRGRKSLAREAVEQRLGRRKWAS